MLLVRLSILSVVLLSLAAGSAYSAAVADEATSVAESEHNEAAAQLLAVDAGDSHVHESEREARQFRTFGFGRPFFGGGFRRPYGFYGRPYYGGFYRPGFYGGYRPYYGGYGGYGGFYRPRPFYGFYG